MTLDPNQHGYVAARPRKRLWPWVVGALTLALLCGFGSVAMLGAGTAAVVNEVEQQSISRTADITITKCETDTAGDLSSVTIRYTIVNSADVARPYIPEFDVVAADGAVIGSATDFVQELKAGGTHRGKAMGLLSEGTKGKLTCKLRGA
jgi:hypothetical protein